MQANRDPFQARIAEMLSLLGQQESVCGQGQVFQSFYRSQLSHQDFELISEKGLATREANLADTQADEESGHAADFLKGKDVVFREEPVSLAENLRGHTEGTPEVAPVGDRDTQVSQRPPEEVENPVCLLCGSFSTHAPEMVIPPLPNPHFTPEGRGCTNWATSVSIRYTERNLQVMDLAHLCNTYLTYIYP